MPTVKEWLDALVLPRTVTIVSSPDLVNRVESKRLAHDSRLTARGRPVPKHKPLAVLEEFKPSRELNLSPATLLHKIGVITTPPVPNLADLCASWAYFRYLWAFQPTTTPGRLRLSDYAKDIDFHQKGLLSDEIGVGMAGVLMEIVFGAPLSVDVSVARDDPIWPIELRETPSPDYLFFNSGHSRLYVVECKGSQGSKDVVLDQLRRGSEQLPSLEFLDGRKPPSYVIATHLSRDCTCVYCLDPPDDDEGSRSARESGEKQNVWRVNEPEAFAARNRLLAAAKLLSYAGDAEAASAKAREAGLLDDGRPQHRIMPSVVVENAFGVFSGVQRLVDDSDGVEVSAFQGLDRRVRAAVVGGGEFGTGEKRQLTKRERDVIEHPGVTVDEAKDRISVTSVALDGSVLQVSVRQR